MAVVVVVVVAVVVVVVVVVVPRSIGVFVVARSIQVFMGLGGTFVLVIFISVRHPSSAYFSGSTRTAQPSR